MSSLPSNRPATLSLGPLESEILEILWVGETMTVRQIHDKILADPDRELAYASVTTVLNRLLKKGWVQRDRQEQAFIWKTRFSKLDAQALKTHDQLQSFLEMGQPDVIAAFADAVDEASLDQLEAIARQIKGARDLRQES